jgi:hypothetical protein
MTESGLHYERYLAARLHVAPTILRNVLKSKRGATFSRTLSAFEYQGLLSDFAGRRWWRAGIDHWLWRETKRRPLDKTALRLFLQRWLPRVPISDLHKPVVALDNQFRPTDKLIELTSAIQIKPDDWPLGGLSFFAEPKPPPQIQADHVANVNSQYHDVHRFAPLAEHMAVAHARLREKSEPPQR